MDTLDISLIKLNVNIDNKEDVFKEISQLAFQGNRISDSNKFLNEMNKREADCSTAFGDLIAIPHAKSDTVKESFLGLIRLTEAISWGEEKVKIVFFIGVDVAGANRLHLEILAAISRRIIDDEFKDQLLNADSEIEVLNILKNTLKEGQR